MRTGIRQLARAAPLETTVVKGLKIPTIEEILRIKAYLIVKRNATRDFIDFVALSDHLGVDKSLKALDSLDSLYPQTEKSTSISQQLAIQLAEPKPWDLLERDLANYKSLKGPYVDWKEIERHAYTIGQKLAVRRMQE